MNRMKLLSWLLIAAVTTVLATAPGAPAVGLTDAEVENIVKRSYQYVAMYNVINKGAIQEENPNRTGWNGTFAASGLLDHNAKAIARPNNDTLYDAKNGFFIPNEQKKYSVGENAGFKLDEDGGIEIHIAAEQPQGVPRENWLPINRKDEALDIVMRIYDPDLEKMKSWQAPKAEKLK